MKKNKEISEYEFDSLWMSIRYCIGRHTIASHCHAKDIASIENKRLSDEQKQHISKLINDEIYDVLSVSSNFTIEERWSIPQNEFRPLDLYYQALQTLNINNVNDFKKIHNIVAFYNKDEQKWYFECACNTEFKCDKYISLMGVQDLEVWQCLANLFDITNHKCVTYNNEKIIYYETMSLKNGYEDIWNIKKIKRPIVETWNIDTITLNEKIFQ